jgi:hypothetical protein
MTRMAKSDSKLAISEALLHLCLSSIPFVYNCNVWASNIQYPNPTAEPVLCTVPFQRESDVRSISKSPSRIILVRHNLIN